MARLQMVAMLRRAWFTMEEIRQMQEDPNSIQETLHQYRLWFRRQKWNLDTDTPAQYPIPVNERIQKYKAHYIA